VVFATYLGFCKLEGVAIFGKKSYFIEKLISKEKKIFYLISISRMMRSISSATRSFNALL
jgi:hypothetical protein